MNSPLQRELEYFVEVVENENFSKAADYLEVKQSSLSKAVMKLESSLQCKLLIRGPRKLKLTEAGKIFYEAALNLRREWKEACLEYQSLDKSVSGSFSLACYSSVGNLFLPQFYREVSDFPGLEVKVKLMTSRQAVEKVRNMDVDFCVVAAPIEYPDLVISPLWKEHLGLYSLDGREKETMVYNSDMIGVGLALRNYPTLPKIVIKDYELIKNMVLHNRHFMGLLPSHVAQREKKLKLLKKYGETIKVSLVYRSDRLKTKGFQQCLSLVKKFKI